MPVVIFVLGIAVFAQGTSEFMLSGLIEPIAADTGVSIGSAGLSTSLFAVGMIVGAPLMAVIAGRSPARYALTGFLSLFAIAHVIGAVTTSFGILLVTRTVAAVANAGFLAVALAALPAMVGAHRVGRATSVILSGVTLACIAGVPAGAFLGQSFGWRSAFWAVAAISVPALVATWLLVRAPAAGTWSIADHGPIRQEWSALGRPRVRTVLVLGALVNASTFATFTYLAVVTTEIAAAESVWVPIVLALFGIGSFIGVTFSGRYADRHSSTIVTIGGILLLIVWIATALTAEYLPILLMLATVSGAISFAVGSTLIGLIVSAATATAPRLNGAFATAALNIGAAVGPATAGLTISSTGTSISALWTSALLAATVVIVAATTRHHWKISTPADSMTEFVGKPR